MSTAISDDIRQHLSAVACHTREDIIRMVAGFGGGHIGGAMSVVELLVLLYERHLYIDPQKPDLPNRDRLILSKGHAAPALYSLLSRRGYFPSQWFSTFNQGGTRLPSHVDMARTPGVDMTTGSLGQGLSVGIGLALGNRLNHSSGRVYVILSDGESNEGQVWEAAMAAAQYDLDNLIAFTDYNKMQIDGYQKDVMSLGDIVAKWQSFGWFVQRVSGHDFQEMDVAIRSAHQEKIPSMIVLDTIKGKGAFLAEGKVEGHYIRYDLQEAEAMIRTLRDE